MNSISPSVSPPGTPPTELVSPVYRAEESIKNYFNAFETLAKLEKWDEIISQGTIALQASRNADKPQEEAKICAQLTSTAFYQGDYTQALTYANRCHELSEKFADTSLFLRALYLESAVYRGLAARNNGEQASFSRAVEVAEEAIHIYFIKGVNDVNLRGKIYFNLGAAHADNLKGDLSEAKNCYSIALECYEEAGANDDLIRTSIRLGKVYLLQKEYDSTQKIIDEVRPQISNERLAMHADYLEAQLKLVINDFGNATKIARNGLIRAQTLGAKEDEARLSSLMNYLVNIH